MNNLDKLYDENNKDLLENISLINFCFGFDKSVVNFKDIDLFIFLENIGKYDFSGKYDDIFYILETLRDAFKHISRCINTQIRRTHKIMQVETAKELDSKSIEWIARQNGLTIKQKLSRGKVLGVKRFQFIDTYENRVVKIVLMRLVAINRINQLDSILWSKMARFIRDSLSEVNHKGSIIANNILLHHKYYSKFYKVYKWLNFLEDSINDFGSFRKNILKHNYKLKEFIILALLHKYTKARILPNILHFDRKIKEKYNVKFDCDNLLELDIKDFLIQDCKGLKDFNDKCLESILNNDTLKRADKLEDSIKSSENEDLFMDIFRIYPLARSNNITKTLPLFLKIKKDSKIINANDSKIIIKDNFYTLIDGLNPNDNKLLDIFLVDIKAFAGNSQKLYYILPDYINIFDFDKKHKSVRAYFSKAFFIPKSILPAAKLLFNDKIKKNDTLLYFQKNNKGEVFVTPILVRYKDELKSSESKGLYLEKYPTKKLKKDIESNDKLIQILLEKCLQNGLKALLKNDIRIYDNKKILKIPYFESKMQDYIKDFLPKIKELYANYKKLFQYSPKTIYDDAKENLIYYQKLIEEKDKGYKLWGERLPRLDMGIESDIALEKFNLVNENSELDSNNTLHIKNHFTIPKGVAKITHPLYLDNEEIDYFMVLESKEMPFKDDVKCRLELTYSCEEQHPYTLTFIPIDIDKSIESMQAKWSKEKPERKNIYPPFPEKKSIDELKHYPKKESKETNDLFDWVEKKLDLVSKEIHESQANKIQASVYSVKDNFVLATDSSGNKIFCPKKNFIHYKQRNKVKTDDFIFLTIHQTQKGFEGKNISLYSLAKLLYDTRFPMNIIFNNCSLQESDIPHTFYKKIRKFTNFINSRFKTIENKKFIEKYYYFFSLLYSHSPSLYDLHDCSPLKCDLQATNLDRKIFANIIGNATNKVQQEIFNKAINKKINGYTEILSIALWRSEKLVFNIPEKTAQKMIADICNYLNNQSSSFMVARNIEILLALLRLRQKNMDILNPDDKLTQNLIENLINYKKKLKSYLKLDVKKPAKYEDMPDLIYALISFIRGKNTNQIKITGVNDEN